MFIPKFDSVTQHLDVAFIGPAIRIGFENSKWKQYFGVEIHNNTRNYLSFIVKGSSVTADRKWSGILKYGFGTCGIHPLHKQKLLDGLPQYRNSLNVD